MATLATALSESPRLTLASLEAEYLGDCAPFTTPPKHFSEEELGIWAGFLNGEYHLAVLYLQKDQRLLLTAHMQQIVRVESYHPDLAKRALNITLSLRERNPARTDTWLQDYAQVRAELDKLHPRLTALK